MKFMTTLAALVTVPFTEGAARLMAGSATFALT